MATSTLFRPGFMEYYRQGHFSDVTILTQQKSYRAHRMVLAFSSEFFEAMLLSEFQETQTAVIDLRKTYDPHEIFPEVLKIIYSGRMELTQAKVVPLLAMSDVLLIKFIHEKCVEFIASNLNKDNALNFLVDAIELHQERLAQQCLKMLASSFLHICDDTDFSGLDADHFVQLVCHPRLAVNNEWKLFQVILKWLEKNEDSPSSAPNNTLRSSTTSILFSTVRYFYFSFEQLLEASQIEIVPKHLLINPLLARLQLKESPKTPLPAHLKFPPRLSCGIQFEVNEEERPRGIIHWLGTKEGTQPWANPSTAGIVTVHASSVERGVTSSLVDSEPQELWTHDVPASWLSVDLGRYRVLPHAYMLRHGGNYRADSLRNWDFQGSVDGKAWVVLKRHSNDPTLSAPFATKTFHLDKSPSVPFQWFRIIQTGHNSTNHNFLVLSGFELFGELWDQDAWSAPNSNPGAGGTGSGSAVAGTGSVLATGTNTGIGSASGTGTPLQAASNSPAAVTSPNSDAAPSSSSSSSSQHQPQAPSSETLAASSSSAAIATSSSSSHHQSAPTALTDPSTSMAPSSSSTSTDLLT